MSQDFGNPVQSYPNYYAIGKDIQFFAAHGVHGVFEEGPGIAGGDGSDLEELKDYVPPPWMHSFPDYPDRVSGSERCSCPSSFL